MTVITFIRRSLVWALCIVLIALAIVPYALVIVLCLPVYLLTGWDNLVGFGEDFCESERKEMPTESGIRNTETP